VRQFSFLVFDSEEYSVAMPKLEKYKTKTGTLWEPVPVLSRHVHPFDVADSGRFGSIKTKASTGDARR
jgi:hypothetical protein